MLRVHDIDVDAYGSPYTTGPNIIIGNLSVLVVYHGYGQHHEAPSTTATSRDCTIYNDSGRYIRLA